MSDTCKKCSAPLLARGMNVSQFKKRVHVGSVLIGFSTGKRVRVTAIGQKRFLYVGVEYRKENECVSKIENVAANWRLVSDLKVNSK